MAKLLSVLAFASLAQFGSAAQVESSSTPIPVSRSPTGASDPIPEAFVSYSIEFAFFPDYAGGFIFAILLVYLSLTHGRKHLVSEYVLEQPAPEHWTIDRNQALHPGWR
jgi:hypothetical protein